jgi:hypothetical protein
MELWAVIFEAASGVVIAIITGLFARALKKGKQREDEMDRRAEVRAKESHLSMNLMSASVALGVANTHAIQNGRTNGETEAALKEADKAIKAYRDFTGEVAANALNNND